ncbi:threonine dehydratase [Dendrobium catenatum]|uniref:Threonine dehydratase n=1 Tax=Dendrobium catenatum TaxID=906689 RepID=A0A2I0W6X4_9ASPA|nr:threonine dehydratase [Dendrobium catenatum]
MVKSLIWNVRGIGGKDSKTIVKNICRIHNIQILVLLEPMIAISKIDNTASKLGYINKFAIYSNKIWIFWKNAVTVDSREDFIQGDFNVIANVNERLGGNHPNFNAMEDFNSMISSCDLHDIGFFGNAYTWNRGNLWQRLDRVLFNQDWIAKFHMTNVEHLSRTVMIMPLYCFL